MSPRAERVFAGQPIEIGGRLGPRLPRERKIARRAAHSHFADQPVPLHAAARASRGRRRIFRLEGEGGKLAVGKLFGLSAGLHLQRLAEALDT